MVHNFSDPRVSVVMPVYNTCSYLTESIASILSQSFEDFELIIVDDGSTDSSAAVIESISAGDPRVKVLFKDHEGIPSARNAGIDMAKGELYAVMDSDDVAMPDRFPALKRASEPLALRSRLGAIVADVDRATRYPKNPAGFHEPGRV